MLEALVLHELDASADAAELAELQAQHVLDEEEAAEYEAHLDRLHPAVYEYDD